MSSETYWAMRRREMAKHEPEKPVKKSKAKKEKAVAKAKAAPKGADLQGEGEGTPSSEEAAE